MTEAEIGPMHFEAGGRSHEPTNMAVTRSCEREENRLSLQSLQKEPTLPMS